METFDASRITLAASAVGAGRAAVEYAVGYAKERHAFGRPIADFQAVSFRLADAALKVDQARLITHHAARLFDAGRPAAKEAAMAKLAASEAASFAADALRQDARRLRLLARVPRGEVAPRLQAPRALGRHQRHHAPDRRPRTPQGLRETP